MCVVAEFSYCDHYQYCMFTAKVNKTLIPSTFLQSDDNLLFVFLTVPENRVADMTLCKMHFITLVWTALEICVVGI